MWSELDQRKVEHAIVSMSIRLSKWVEVEGILIDY